MFYENGCWVNLLGYLMPENGCCIQPHFNNNIHKILYTFKELMIIKFSDDKNDNYLSWKAWLFLDKIHIHYYYLHSCSLSRSVLFSWCYKFTSFLLLTSCRCVCFMMYCSICMTEIIKPKYQVTGVWARQNGKVWLRQDSRSKFSIVTK